MRRGAIGTGSSCFSPGRRGSLRLRSSSCCPSTLRRCVAAEIPVRRAAPRLTLARRRRRRIAGTTSRLSRLPARRNGFLSRAVVLHGARSAARFETAKRFVAIRQHRPARRSVLENNLLDWLHLHLVRLHLFCRWFAKRTRALARNRVVYPIAGSYVMSGQFSFMSRLRACESVASSLSRRVDLIYPFFFFFLAAIKENVLFYLIAGVIGARRSLVFSVSPTKMPFCFRRRVSHLDGRNQQT